MNPARLLLLSLSRTRASSRRSLLRGEPRRADRYLDRNEFRLGDSVGFLVEAKNHLTEDLIVARAHRRNAVAAAAASSGAVSRCPRDKDPISTSRSRIGHTAPSALRPRARITLSGISDRTAARPPSPATDLRRISSHLQRGKRPRYSIAFAYLIGVCYFVSYVSFYISRRVCHLS